MHDNFFIKPNWMQNNWVKAYTTLRVRVETPPPFDEFNLGANINLSEEKYNNALKNRCFLKEELGLRHEPFWLQQTHSDIITELTLKNNGLTEADASYTLVPNVVCAILTADCLPVLLGNEEGTLVAAIHAGWRGLANHIINKTCALLNTKTNSRLKAWLGPAISAHAYEIGEEVFAHFCALHPSYERAFKKTKSKKWLMDLYYIARLQLKNSGIEQIYGGEYCTYSNQAFFSYRRDGAAAGRMATLIWFNDSRNT